jgi:hypothetical protein
MNLKLRPHPYPEQARTLQSARLSSDATKTTDATIKKEVPWTKLNANYHQTDQVVHIKIKNEYGSILTDEDSRELETEMLREKRTDVETTQL